MPCSFPGLASTYQGPAPCSACLVFSQSPPALILTTLATPHTCAHTFPCSPLPHKTCPLYLPLLPAPHSTSKPSPCPQISLFNQT